MSAELLRGVDLSHWSGVVNWPTVRQSNQVKFVIAKCTEGLDFLDSQYASNLTGAWEQQIAFAAYHFYRHNGEPIKQAKWFANNCNLPSGSLLICDVETTIAKTLAQISAVDRVEFVNSLSSLARDVVSFCTQLEEMGYTPLIYTSPSFAKSYLQDERLACWDLWIANVQTNQPTIPAPWAQFGAWPDNKHVPLWQDTWTLQIQGIPEAAVDGDYFTPAAGDLYEFFGNGAPYNPDIPEIVKAHNPGGYVNIRYGPGYGYTIIGKAPHGLELHVTGISDYKEWYKCGTGWINVNFCKVIE